MRQLIRTRREREPHLSCGNCLSEATFTGPGWAALETVTLVWVGVQAGSPQSRGQTLGKCWVCRQRKTPALGQMPALSCAALGKCHDLSVPQVCNCKTENGPPTGLLYGLYE